jgi:hypothetical protein
VHLSCAGSDDSGSRVNSYLMAPHAHREPFFRVFASLCAFLSLLSLAGGWRPTVPHVSKYHEERLRRIKGCKLAQLVTCHDNITMSMRINITATYS